MLAFVHALRSGELGEVCPEQIVVDGAARLSMSVPSVNEHGPRPPARGADMRSALPMIDEQPATRMR